jgi:hypothetical protein
MLKGEQPLVSVVSAHPGTKGAAVLEEMMAIVKDGTLEGFKVQLSFSFEKEEGLFLRDSDWHKKSYSLRYERRGDLMILPIGKEISGNRATDAARNILRMIERGRNWVAFDGQKKEEVVITEAYGREKNPMAVERRRTRKHARKFWRRLPGYAW